MNKIKGMNCKGFSFMYVLGFLCIIGLIIKGVTSLPQYKTMMIKRQVKKIVPIMKQWVEAKDDWYKKHGHNCKTVGVNGACTSYPDGSDLGVHWPSNWHTKDPVTKKKKPCGNSINCSNNTVGCLPLGRGISCTIDYKILILGGESSLNPLGNQVSCIPVHDKPSNDGVKWKKAYEEEAAICKEISGKEPINMPYRSISRDFYPL